MNTNERFVWGLAVIASCLLTLVTTYAVTEAKHRKEIEHLHTLEQRVKATEARQRKLDWTVYENEQKQEELQHEIDRARVWANDN